jgi:hypothetical protein
MVADPITGREFRVRTNAVVVNGEVKPKLPTKPKAANPVVKGRTGKAVTNRLLADWSDPDRKEHRGAPATGTICAPGHRYRPPGWRDNRGYKTKD